MKFKFLPNDIVRLFHSRGDDFLETCRFADQLRRDVNGDVVTYVVNRNINYTNVCWVKCDFCAFYRVPGSPEGYTIPKEQIFEKITPEEDDTIMGFL